VSVTGWAVALLFMGCPGAAQAGGLRARDCPEVYVKINKRKGTVIRIFKKNIIDLFLSNILICVGGLITVCQIEVYAFIAFYPTGALTPNRRLISEFCSVQDRREYGLEGLRGIVDHGC